MSWPILRDFLLLVIGGVLVFTLTNFDDSVDRATNNALEAIAGHCRVLIEMDVVLSEDGSCYRPEVKAIWEDHYTTTQPPSVENTDE